MALDLEDPELERLLGEVASVTGETRTEMVRRALQERLERLRYRLAEADRRSHLLRFLEEEVWPQVPPEQLGRCRSREEEDVLLG